MYKVHNIFHDPKNVYEMIWPGYLYLYYIRFLNFTIKCELVDGLIESNKFDKFCYGVYVCLLSYLLYTTFYHPNPNTTSDINIIRFGNAAFLFSGIFTTVITISILNFYKKQFWNIFRSMYLFDKKINTIGYKINYKKQYNQLMVHILITVSIYTTAALTKVVFYGFDVIQVFYIFVPSGNFVVCLSMYIAVIMLLTQRFEILGTCFRYIYIQVNFYHQL